MAKVYVLGAGASRALNDGSPLMSQLNQLVFSAARTSGHDRLKRLRKFIKAFYPDLPPNEPILLEEVLTLLDSQINASRPLSHIYSVDKLRQLREDFIYAISSVLKNSLGTSHLKNEWEWLEFRERTILPFLNGLEIDDSIISLNYDLILDNRIAESLFHGEIYTNIRPEPLVGSEDVNYGFQPRYALMDIDNHRLYSPYMYVPLYKLHGSLNWLYCPSCRRVDVSLGRKGVLHYALEQPSPCRNCGVQYEALLITPTLLKSYDNPYIAQIWREAETKLNEADQIIFVGYSMPDADIVLKTVFSRAIFTNRMLKKRNPEIVVVDVDKSGNVEKTYRRLFGRVKYCQQNFVDYIDENLR